MNYSFKIPYEKLEEFIATINEKKLLIVSCIHIKTLNQFVIIANDRSLNESNNLTSPSN